MISRLPNEIIVNISMYLSCNDFFHMVSAYNSLSHLVLEKNVRLFFPSYVSLDLLKKKSHVYQPCTVLRFFPQPLIKKFKVLYSTDSGQEAFLVRDMSSFERHFVSKNNPCAYPRLVKSNPPTYDMGELFYEPIVRAELGMKIDAMDNQGIWYDARIVEIDNEKVRVHFHGWSSKWDIWYSLGVPMLAPSRTFTKPWREYLTVGTRVQFRYAFPNNRWFDGVICGINGYAVDVMGIDDENPRMVTIDRYSESLCQEGVHGSKHYRSSFFCLHHTRWRTNVASKNRPHVFLVGKNGRKGKYILTTTIVA